MDRKDLEKAIEMTASLFSLLEREDEDKKNSLQEKELEINKNMEEIAFIEDKLASLADMDQDIDQTKNLYENYLQQVGDEVAKVDSIIYECQNSCKDLELETDEMLRSEEGSVRTLLGYCHEGIAMFSDETLGRNIHDLSTEIEELVKIEVANRREICRDLDSVLEGLANQGCTPYLWNEVRDRHEESCRMKEILLTREQEIYELDEELDKYID